jgi:hypothetical protein
MDGAMRGAPRQKQRINPSEKERIKRRWAREGADQRSTATAALIKGAEQQPTEGPPPTRATQCLEKARE